MKKLLLSLLSAFAMASAAHADIAYYYGPVTQLILPTSGEAKAIPGFVLIVADFSANKIQFITLTAPTAAGKAFDYQLSQAIPLSITSLTSTNNVSYTYFTTEANGSGGGNVNEFQILAYGANQSLTINNKGLGPASIPAAVTGTQFSIQFNGGTLAGAAIASNLNVSILLPPTVAENSGQNPPTLASAINAADTFFAGINGNKLP